MIKYSFLLILLSGVLFSCEKEISPEQANSFIKFYGSYLFDEAGDVEVLSGGGYAICGTETSESSGKRMVLIVTDKYGNIKNGFPRYYSEEGLETGGTSLIALQGGNDGFFIAGFVERPLTGAEGVQKDIFLVRTSASGEPTWQRSYGSVEDENISHAIERINSGYLIAGSQLRSGRSDILIMGVTEEGDSIRLGLNYNNPHAENSAASYLLNTGEMYVCACTFDKANNEGTGIEILTFDNDLSPLAKNISGEYDEFGMSVLQEDRNHFLVLGNRAGGSGNSELLIYELESNGLLITESSLLATISEANTDLTGNRIIATADGNLVIEGTMTAGGNSEVFLQFVSSIFQRGGLVSYGAAGAQTGMDIELTNDGGFVVLGNNSSGGGSIISLMKTSSTGDI